jgi:hypothetical protein
MIRPFCCLLPWPSREELLALANTIRLMQAEGHRRRSRIGHRFVTLAALIISGWSWRSGSPAYRLWRSIADERRAGTSGAGGVNLKLSASRVAE